MTTIGGVITALLVWLRCTGHIEYTWLVTMLPLLAGISIDLFMVGLLYWYHEMRNGDEDEKEIR